MRVTLAITDVEHRSRGQMRLQNGRVAAIAMKSNAALPLASEPAGNAYLRGHLAYSCREVHRCFSGRNFCKSGGDCLLDSARVVRYPVTFGAETSDVDRCA